MTADMKCDIILPTCDQFHFTKPCIDSIIANTDMPYRIIVINNGKNPDTKAYLAETKKRLGEGLLVIDNPYNMGWVKALNQGIAVSNAPFLCFQNDDTVVTKGWLRKMIGILQSRPEIGIANPVWEGRSNHVSIEEYGRRIEAKFKGQYIETDWARGFSVILKREVIEKIGGIDERYGLAYFDDVDFSVRAINAGFLVVLALDTYVYHHRNVTFFEVLKGKKWNELHEKNKLIYYKLWGRPLRIVIILSKEVCSNPAKLSSVQDAVYYIARKQHHITLWAPQDLSYRFRHTNIKFKSYPAFLMRIPLSLDLYLNAGKKEDKRYSRLFDFNEGAGLKDPAGFCNFIKIEVDAMKEKTKESIHAEV